MGIKIGCPALKLARTRGKNAGKHTGQLQSVLCEAWECGTDADGKAYRFCKDADYNPALTAGNQYEGIRNAFELGKEIGRVADDYSTVRKMRGGRGLKKTAGIGYTLILKPPAEYVNGLSPAEQEKLRADLLASFKAATADIIRADTINAVWQVDEAGGHWHIAGPALTPDGELNADKIVNPKLYTALNKRLPEEMRQKGWEVDECVNYDPDKAKDMTEEEKADYKAKCKEKRPKSGEDSDKFKARKDRERLEHLEKLMAYCDTVTYKNGRTLGSFIRQAEAAMMKGPAEAPQKPVKAPVAAPTREKPAEPQKPAETLLTASQKPVELSPEAQARVKATLAARRQKQAEADGRELMANIEGYQGGSGKSL